MKDTPTPDQRCKYDAAFRAEALRLAAQRRSAQAAARALNIDPKRLYQWQKSAQTPGAAALGAALDSAMATELRQLRAANRRQALEILKKAITNNRFKRVILQTPEQRAATALSMPSTATIPCDDFARCPACQPADFALGNEASNGRWGAHHRPGKRRWLSYSGCIHAARAPTGCRWPCARKATRWAASACARPCAAGACAPCKPRPTPRAP